MSVRSPSALAVPSRPDPAPVAPARDGFRWILAALCLALAATMALSLLAGSVHLDPDAVYQGLIGSDPDALGHRLVWGLRLPRTLLAVLVGLHLAVSGLILQAVIRNPLGDPGIVGISSGASLLVVTVLLLGDLLNAGLLHNASTEISLAWLPFAALVGGLGAAGLVLGLSWGERVSPVRLALNGVAVGAVLNALVMWVVVVWGGARTEIALIWLAGSLYGRDFEHLLLLLPWTLIGLSAAALLLRPLSLLRFEDETAQSLGLPVRRWRLIALGVAVMLAASATAVAGPVGFVGLVVPHLARRLVGGDMGRLLITTLLCGALLTLGADIAARTLTVSQELPVGALTSLIGIPIFLLLLQRRTRTHP
ncbi:ABC-type transporter, integral membrane subunit [Thiorhodococcus drewsii AZ1]|uniref:ABC-type transporter, integral membrane subunit n=1 Tax=Thiorhodococcus drewsii AZ1 TaxID=765913 RepID=G2E7K4_9GAMM|nr:iron ABC transporter permease [Thiorhodococcus drewsii]EGV27937.1 ABC-type transporter, integral membrane subunit [Thiorhodococcus drewsii AZ1]